MQFKDIIKLNSSLNKTELTLFLADRRKCRMLQQKTALYLQEPNQFEQKIIHDLFIKTIDLKDQNLNSRVLPSGAIWMEHGVISNMIFSHPEDRNAHNTVFGGFLMRHALEISFALAYQFR